MKPGVFFPRKGPSIGAINQQNGHPFFAAPHLWQMEIFKLLARKKTRWTLGGFTKTPLKQLFFFGMSFKTHGGRGTKDVRNYMYIYICCNFEMSWSMSQNKLIIVLIILKTNFILHHTYIHQWLTPCATLTQHVYPQPRKSLQHVLWIILPNGNAAPRPPTRHDLATQRFPLER